MYHYIKNVSEARRKKLQDANIAYIVRDKGILIKDELLELVLEKFKCRVLRRTSSYYNYDNDAVEDIILTTPAATMPFDEELSKNYKIVYEKDEFNSREQYLETLKQVIYSSLIKTFRTNVRIIAPKLSTPIYENAEPDFTNIYFYAAPDSIIKYYHLNEWRGRKLKRNVIRTRDYFDYVITDPNSTEKLDLAGILCDNGIYILTDLISTFTNPDVKLLEIILQEAAQILNKDNTEIINKRKDLQLNKEADLFHRLKEKIRYRDLVKAESTMQDCLMNLERLAGRTAKYYFEYTHAQRYYLELKEKLDDDKNNNFDEIKAIQKLKKVTDVKITEDYLVIFTENLYCVDPRSNLTHDIGKFKIFLPIKDFKYEYTDSDRNSVRWTNLTRLIDGFSRKMHAPHIFNNGFACLGNLSETLPELIGKGKYVEAASIAIQFVETVNTADPAGQNIINWPVFKEKEKEHDSKTN